MPNTGIIVFLLIVAIVVVSYKGFTNRRFFERYKFRVDNILLYKDYKRLVTSGFLHISWMHLFFNVFSLYFFSGAVLSELGAPEFLLIYFVSMVGGDLLSLFIHRNHGDYSSVGASGAVCGVLFASVALAPGMGIQFFLLPFSIPGWIYALAFVLFTIYGIRSRKENVGYESHLGGALVGMLLALAMRPSAFLYNFFPILIIMAPTVLFIYLIITRPETLFVDNLFYRKHRDYYNIDQRYNAERADQQQEVDRILEKISRRGMRSLSKKERETLKDYSKRVR